MKKFLLTAVVTLGAIMGSASLAYAGDIATVNVGDNRIECKMVDSKTYMPIRDVFEELGYTVEWEPDIKAVTLSKEDRMVVIYTLTNSVYVMSTDTTTEVIEGEDFHSSITYPKYVGRLELENKVEFMSNSTYLPFREILEFMGYGIDWDSSTRTATLTGEQADIKTYTAMTSENYADVMSALLAETIGSAGYNNLGEAVTNTTGTEVDDRLVDTITDTVTDYVVEAKSSGSRKVVVEESTEATTAEYVDKAFSILKG